MICLVVVAVFDAKQLSDIARRRDSTGGLHHICSWIRWVRGKTHFYHWPAQDFPALAGYLYEMTHGRGRQAEAILIEQLLDLFKVFAACVELRLNPDTLVVNLLDRPAPNHIRLDGIVKAVLV